MTDAPPITLEPFVTDDCRCPVCLSRSRKGGFTDALGQSVRAGDPVEYRFGARRGVLTEALQDGDAEVFFEDTGEHEIVKWKNLCKVFTIPAISGLTSRNFLTAAAVAPLAAPVLAARAANRAGLMAFEAGVLGVAGEATLTPAQYATFQETLDAPPAPNEKLKALLRSPSLFVESPPLAPTTSRTIVAFTGLAGAGKSTAAMHLVNAHGFQRVRFAGPLKAMMAALGLTPDEIDGPLKEQPCALLGGKTPRWAMQSLGTEWGRDLIDSDLWIRAWRAALPATGNVVVDDCRFPNEAAAVAAAGGIIVRVDRPGAGQGAAGHTSEGQTLGPVFHTVRNAASRGDLLARVDDLVRDLAWLPTS
jgi:hypothetical protein